MPHVEILHFPAELSEAAARRLDSDITAAITRAFGVRAQVVSIGVEGVPAERWTERVYQPLIAQRPATTTLLRRPEY